MATEGRDLDNLGRQCVLSGKGVGRDLSVLVFKFEKFIKRISLAGGAILSP